MQDTYRHKGLRKRLIDTLREKGIGDERILRAFDSVPRHFFLDKAFEEWAYTDKAFPIGNKQTISQPFTVAYQTDLLEVESKDKVLEIGTGSGFQAAILATLGARVFTVERQQFLYQKTAKLLKKLGFKSIRTFLKDGMKGLPEFAPYDKIIVTAAADEIPTTLLSQLKNGGILIIPIGQRRQQMCKIIKVSKSQYQRMYLDYFKFVPLLKGLNREME
ncbi:MAG: protein-L-isoaspartate(D-aspartate) O-methyltransferase [Bacteroidota bacterium]